MLNVGGCVTAAFFVAQSLHLCKLISHFQVLLFGDLWLFHIFTHHLSIRWRLWQRRHAHLLKAATLILSNNTSDRLHLNAAETTQLSLLWKQGEVLYNYTYPKIHFLHFTVSSVLLSFFRILGCSTSSLYKHVWFCLCQALMNVANLNTQAASHTSLHSLCLFPTSVNSTVSVLFESIYTQVINKPQLSLMDFLVMYRTTSFVSF